MLRSINYSGLISPIDPKLIAEFKTNRRHDFGYSTFGVTVTVFWAIVVGVFFLFAIGGPLLAWIGSTLRAAFVDGEGVASLPGLFLLFMTLAGLIAVVVLGASSWRRARGTWEQFYRMNQFADDNGLVYSPLSRNVPYPGLIFDKGSSRTMRNQFRGENGRTLEYGNYHYVTGSGKNRKIHKWGFLALELDRSLPHMVLDARGNNQLFGMSNLPTAFSRTQVLKLEGDFNNHFTLYCPREYERDALYIFTPDLMALLIDHAAIFDVEVVDRWLLVYSPQHFDLVDPAVHRRLLGIADTVGKKALRQTRRYADERIGDSSINLVAPRGQRLKRTASTTAIVLTGGLAVLWLLTSLFSTFG